MKIAIIGTGTVGSALARRLKKSTHQVILGARDVTDGATGTGTRCRARGFQMGRLLLRTGAMLLSPDELLPHCSRCGTWPMPAAFIERGRAWGRIRFRCPGCGMEELHEVGASAPTLVPRVNAGQGVTVTEDSK